MTAERAPYYSVEVSRESGPSQILYPVKLPALLRVFAEEGAGYVLDADARVTARPLRFICGPEESFERITSVLSALAEVRPVFSRVSLITSRGERTVQIPAYGSVEQRQIRSSQKRIVFTVQPLSSSSYLSGSEKGDGIAPVLRIGQGGALDRTDFLRGLRAILRGSPEIKESVVELTRDCPCRTAHFALELAEELFSGRPAHLAVPERETLAQSRKKNRRGRGNGAGSILNEPGESSSESQARTEEAKPKEEDGGIAAAFRREPTELVYAAEIPRFEIVARAKVIPTSISAVVEEVALEDGALADGSSGSSDPTTRNGSGAGAIDLPRLRSFEPGLEQFALENALRWLVARQDPSGAWFDGVPGDGASADSRQPAGSSEARPADEEVCGRTARCVLAFLQSGVSVRVGRFKPTVGAGLDYLGEHGFWELLGDPSSEPRVGFRETWSEDLIVVALALIEGFGATGDEWRRAHAERALEGLVLRQNPDGGWGRRDGVPVPDSGGGKREIRSSLEATGWATAALHAACRAGLPFPQETLRRLRRGLWPEEEGSLGVGDRSSDLLWFCRFLVEEKSWESERVSKARQELGLGEAEELRVEDLPALRHLQFRLAAAYQAGGPGWFELQDRALGALLAGQHREGGEVGSFPDGSGGPAGTVSRIDATVFWVLSTATTERYDRFDALR